MKHRFIDFTQVLFCGDQKAENRFSGLFDHLKHLFIDLIEVTFYDIQKADNEFSGPFAYLKLHFRDLVQVAFWMPRRQKMISHGLSTP
jgi:hypothetical protein